MQFVSSPDIFISKVTLSIEPSNEVAWDANVTLRCQAELNEPETVQFTIYKGEKVVYTKTKSSSNDLLYPLTNLKLANSGPYNCGVKLEDEEKTSDDLELTVTGVFAVMDSV